jgi:hypothetical protein
VPQNRFSPVRVSSWNLTGHARSRCQLKCRPGRLASALKNRRARVALPSAPLQLHVTGFRLRYSVGVRTTFYLHTNQMSCAPMPFNYHCVDGVHPSSLLCDTELTRPDAADVTSIHSCAPWLPPVASASLATAKLDEVGAEAGVRVGATRVCALARVWSKSLSFHVVPFSCIYQEMVVMGETSSR